MADGHKRSGMLDSQYVCIPKFSNSLPPAPSGPFFQKVGRQIESSEYSKYRMSSLEKSYVWKPHMGWDLGMKLDLVDRKAVLIEVGESSARMTDRNPSYMSAATNSGAAVDLSGATWLRKTTYTDNQIMNRASRVEHKDQNDQGDEDATAEEAALERHSKRKIEDSFDDVKRTLETLKRSNKKAKTSWTSPLVPDAKLWSESVALIRFDEDPYVGIEGGAVPSGALLTHFVPLDNEGGQWRASLVAPSSASASSSPDEIPADVTYCSWVRDFRLALHSQKIQGSYALAVDPSGETTFCPLRVKLDLRKYQGDGTSSHEHEAYVVRRELTADEIAAAEAFREELG